MKKLAVLLASLVMLFGIYNADAAVKLASKINNYTALSTDTKPSGTTVPAGSILVETDKGRSYIYNGSAWTIKVVEATTDTVRMTAPGNGTAQSTAGYNKANVYFTVSAINTSVTTALQVRAGNSGWTSVGTDSTTFTTNDNHGLEYEGLASADSVRFKFISEAGGTAAIIIYNMKLSNPK
jgi:hypothetical protein